MFFRYVIGFTILILVIVATVLILDSNNSSPNQAFGMGSSGGDPSLEGCSLNGAYYNVDSRNCAFHVGAGMYGGSGCSGLYSGDLRLVVKPDCIFTMW